MPSIQSISNKKPNQAANISTQASQLPALELRIELGQALQATLEYEEQLKIFANWLSDKLKTASVSYTNEALGIELSLGRDARHSCEYDIGVQKEKLGQLVVTRAKKFTEEDLEFVEIALSTLIYPLRNAMRYQQALKLAMLDPLTGAGNRIALDNTLRRELQLSERYDQALSLLVIDIDHFKTINDQFGHSIGDQVIKNIVGAIKAIIRDSDLTFRYGGEEFVVVLSKTDNQGAGLIAKRICDFIADSVIEIEGNALNVTVSIGVSSLENGEHVKSMFDRADRALYLAKQRGRNQVASESHNETCES
ncbi:GGDEF domain-containing protein [Aurantivibrio plasticivorans]